MKLKSVRNAIYTLVWTKAQSQINIQIEPYLNRLLRELVGKRGMLWIIKHIKSIIDEA